ncbi:MAG: response regulator transcription factor [bacterium]
MSIRILVAEDHDDMRNHIGNLCNNVSDCKIISEVTNGLQAVQMAKKLNPDVVLMDIGMPELNGMAATHLIKEYNTAIKIIGLTMLKEINFVVGMFKAGASGYILKDTLDKELTSAVRLVNQDKIYMSKTIEKNILLDYLEKMNRGDCITARYLSSGDLEILRMLVQGLSLESISETSVLNSKTVEIIYQKILQTWVMYIRSGKG